jgi:hypothetical protein
MYLAGNEGYWINAVALQSATCKLVVMKQTFDRNTLLVALLSGRRDSLSECELKFPMGCLSAKKGAGV